MKEPTPVPTIDCGQYKWHMATSPTEPTTCTNDKDYPSVWDMPQNSFFMHSTSESCCDKLFTDQNCKVIDRCNPQNQAKKDEAAAAAEDAKAADEAKKVAAAFAAAEAAKENEANNQNQAGGGNQGPGGGGQEPVDYVPDGPFVDLDGGTDDFEGDGTIPWIFGSPPQWKIVDTEAFSQSHSITNIPSSEFGATSNLSAKINLKTSTTMVCKLKLDMGMPFERLSFHVNGKQQNIFYQRTEDWTTFTSGLPAGEVMIPDFDRMDKDQVERYGTGNAYLDQCNLRKT